MTQQLHDLEVSLMNYLHRVTRASKDKIINDFVKGNITKANIVSIINALIDRGYVEKTNEPVTDPQRLVFYDDDFNEIVTSDREYMYQLTEPGRTYTQNRSASSSVTFGDNTNFASNSTNVNQTTVGENVETYHISRSKFIATVASSVLGGLLTGLILAYVFGVGK